MDGKHTPGEWFFDALTNQVKDCATERDAIALVLGLGPFGIFSEESRANARLMAAAPDLLEACQTMLDWDAAENNAEAWEKNQGKAWRERLALCSLAFDRARAAIAKANQAREVEKR